MFEISLFEKIASKGKPALVEGIHIDRELALGIVDIHRDLSEPHRDEFLAMPLEHIVRFTTRRFNKERSPLVEEVEHVEKVEHVEAKNPKPQYEHQARLFAKVLSETVKQTAEALNEQRQHNFT